MTVRSVVFASNSTLQDGGYHVVAAFSGPSTQCVLAARELGSSVMVEDLLRESMSALSRSLPSLAPELRAGVVIGRHGSARRLTAETRFFVCEPELREVQREGWLFLAERIVDDTHEQWVRDATSRLAAMFSFEAFCRSVRADVFARGLRECLEARLHGAAVPDSEVSTIIADLRTLGHPLVPYLSESTGDGYVLEVFGYDPPPAARFGLRVTVEVEAEADEPREIRVEVQATEATTTPPGFPVE